MGLFTALTVLWVWWPSRSVQVVHDEAAYVLQADLLAHGHFAAPSPLEPELSEQAAVIVSPVLAPKPMPGHAVLLAPGVILGLPWLMPILLTGITAALLFALVRGLADGATALLAVALWITAPGVLRWQPSYLSEVSSTALVLVGGWCAIQWWKLGTQWWLAACAFVFGLLAVTRPFTAVAVAVPVAALIVLRLGRTRAWRHVPGALAIGLLPIALVPIQSHAVTGQWNRTPWSLYSVQYMPWDRPGFGLDNREPLRTLPPDLRAAMSEFKQLHAQHQLRALPALLLTRIHAVWRQQTSGWRFYLIPGLVLVGLLAAGWAAVFVASVMTLQFVLYLTYAHQPFWTLYYAELVPPFVALAAIGLARIDRFSRGNASTTSIVTSGMAILVVGMALPLFQRQRLQHLNIAKPWMDLERALEQTTDEPRFVYVRYGGDHDPHQSLVRNSRLGGESHLQLVYEPPPEVDRTLRQSYPGYQFWRYDAETRTIRRLE